MSVYKNKMVKLFVINKNKNTNELVRGEVSDHILGVNIGSNYCEIFVFSKDSQHLD